MTMTHEDAIEPAGVSELLPCPFCGGTDVDPEGWATTGGIAGPACNTCLASVGSALSSTAENIAAWNRRAALSCIEAGPGAKEGKTHCHREGGCIRASDDATCDEEGQCSILLDIAALSTIGGEAEPVAWGVYLNDGRFMDIASSSKQDASDMAEVHYETAEYHIRPLYASVQQGEAK